MVNNYVYVIGGGSQFKPKRSCERYSIQENKWEWIAPLNIEWFGPSICCFNSDIIFAIGGRTRDILALDSIEFYSIKQNLWY